MNPRMSKTAILALLTMGLANQLASAGDKASPVTWKKTTIEGKFRSEGVAIADVNKDGKPDILIGGLVVRAPRGQSIRHPQAGRLRRRSP